MLQMYALFLPTTNGLKNPDGYFIPPETQTELDKEKPSRYPEVKELRGNVTINTLPRNLVFDGLPTGRIAGIGVGTMS